MVYFHGKDAKGIRFILPVKNHRGYRYIVEVESTNVEKDFDDIVKELQPQKHTKIQTLHDMAKIFDPSLAETLYWIDNKELTSKI